MNWEAVGAVAELVGALGVIASLVYLGRQIQASSENVNQNTRALISILSFPLLVFLRVLQAWLGRDQACGPMTSGCS